MPSTYLTLSDNQTLAEYVPAAAFSGLLQNRVAISPDHVALLMRDGQIVDAFVGAHFGVGGLWQRLKEAIGGPHALRLLVADLKPFLVQAEIEGISRDGVPLGATVAIEFQVDPEKPANILGLMPEQGALDKADVYARVVPHLRDRVFQGIFSRVDAGEVRGNTALQDKVQADLLLEVRRLFHDLGLLVRGASLSWALNDAERAAMARSAAEREQRSLDDQFANRRRALEREKDATTFQLQADLDLERVRAAGEDELRHLVLDQELRFVDTRQAGVRTQELKTLEHELQLLSVQRRAGYEKALEDAANEVERARARRNLTALELEVDSLREEQRLRLARLREEQELAIAAAARQQQLDTMRGLHAVELEAKERGRRIDRDDRMADEEARLRAAQQASLAEVERLRVQAQMSPDQILAIAAGLSPEVAGIFAERARVMSIDVEKREALLREMVQLTAQGRMASEEQARFFFDKAMQSPPPPAAAPAAETETAECPGCHRRPPVSDRFCRYCGFPLRT